MKVCSADCCTEVKTAARPLFSCCCGPLRGTGAATERHTGRPSIQWGDISNGVRIINGGQKEVGRGETKAQQWRHKWCRYTTEAQIKTLRTGDADLRFYITTVQDGWRKSAFLKRACFPCTLHLIIQYVEPVSEWSCWRMFIETWPHSELTFRHRASSI